MRQRLRAIKGGLREFAMVAFLCVQIVLIFVLGPLLTVSQGLPVNLLTLLFVMVISIVAFAVQNIVAGMIVVGALLLSTAAVVLRQVSETLLTDWLAAIGAATAVMTLTWVVLKMVMSPGRMSGYRIVGAVVIYLNTAIFFSILFRLIAERVPGSFSGIPAAFVQKISFGDLMYFSMTTLTTTGYGDITPINPVARSLATLEAIIGQLYPAIIISRLITLYTPKSRHKE
jgi:voltage-gated potassium channel Kch